MKCTNCGTQNPSEKKFCTNCGNRLADPQVKADSRCECGAETPPGKKFCVNCGKPVTRAPDQAPVCGGCGTVLVAGKRFCTNCGKPVGDAGVTASPTAPAAGQVELATNQPTLSVQLKNDTVVWRIQPGVVVENVDAARAATLCLARRLVVEPGTRMLVYMDGVLEGELLSGAFNLPTIKSDQIPGYRPRTVKPSERNPNPATGGVLAVFDAVRNGTRRVFNWFRERVIGVRESDLSPERRQERSAEQSRRGQDGGAVPLQLIGDAVRWERNLNAVRGDSVVHVILARCGSFRLQFVFPGISTAKKVSVDIGMEIEVMVADLQGFFERFVVDKGVLTMDDLALELSPFLKTRVAERLRTFMPEDLDHSDQVHRALEGDITAELQRTLPGITLKRVLSVTMKHEEIERLNRLRQELVVARDGLDLTRDQSDFQNLIELEVTRSELMGLGTAEERRRALREFHEIVVATNDITIDRKGNEVQRSRLSLRGESQSLERQRRQMDAEFEGFLEKLEMARRLEQARSVEEETVAMQEIEQRGLLRDESREVLQEQLTQRRSIRGMQSGQELWATQEGFNVDREKTGSINRQFLALMGIDHRYEQQQKQRDWDHKFLSEDDARQFEADRDRLIRKGELRGIAQSQELGDVQHGGRLAESRREQTRLDLVAEVGFEQLYGDKEMIKIREAAKRREVQNESRVSDAQTDATIARSGVDTAAYSARVNLGIRAEEQEIQINQQSRQLDLSERQDRLKLEVAEAQRTGDHKRILELMEMRRKLEQDERDFAFKMQDQQQSTTLKMREQEQATAVELSRIETERVRIEAEKFRGMTAEQIMMANPDVSAAAAAAYAEANGNRAKIEAQQEIILRERQMAEELQRRGDEDRKAQSAQTESVLDRMERMAKATLEASTRMSETISNTAVGVANASAGNTQNQQAQQSQFNSQILQSEREKTQQALAQGQQYVTSVKEITQTSFGAAAHAATGVPTPPSVVHTTRQRECPQCKEPVGDTDRFCGNCNHKMAP